MTEALWRSSCDGRRLARGQRGGRASRRGRATGQTPLSVETPGRKKYCLNVDKIYIYAMIMYWHTDILDLLFWGLDNVK